MKLAIASDHGGFELKQEIIRYFQDKARLQGFYFQRVGRLS